MNEARLAVLMLLDSQPVKTATPQAVTEGVTALSIQSIQYLTSDAALQSLARDPYWPKWDSPWWHMAILHEMGLSSRIPGAAIRAMCDTVKRQYVPAFFQAEIPAGRDPIHDVPCPCQLGNIYQILSAAGVDVDHVLPWARAWLMRYQMADGGLSCDEEAYHATPQASSMVGTIAPLESILIYTPRTYTAEEAAFVDRGAQCLISRELRLGCAAPHNAEEKQDEPDWLRPSFPRLYFYDVLRGLAFVLKWAEKRRQTLSASSLLPVVKSLCEKYPDGRIIVERHTYEGVGTRMQNAAGAWQREPAATYFELLDRVSALGQVSLPLTAQWAAAQAQIRKLLNEGVIT